MNVCIPEEYIKVGGIPKRTHRRKAKMPKIILKTALTGEVNFSSSF
jgi:hypothetical protein